MLGIHTILVVGECDLLLGLLDYCQTYIHACFGERERRRGSEGRRKREKQEKMNIAGGYQI